MIPEAKQEVRPALAQTKRRVNILYVDDNEVLRDELRSVLIMKGWDCQCANGGEAALQLLTAGTQPVDFLITDHSMPGMNGLELVGKVRALRFTGKILVYSTMLSGLEQALYERLTVDAIVSKISNLEDLIQAIQALLADQKPGE